MNGQKADMVFTDPPYGVEIKGKFTGTILNDNLQGDEFDDFLTACFNNLKLFNKGNLYISYEIRNHTTFENALLSSGFVFDEIIIWNKDSASFYSNNKYNRKFEPIFFIENGKELKCKPDVNVWDFAKSSSFASRDENNKRFNEEGNYLVAHPTTKPLGLITKPLNNSTKENDLILDLFLGSGSTMVASHQLKRKCYGMELDPKYCQVIIDRMKKLNPSLEIKRNGETVK
jgi:DNA modification methylase